MSIFHSLANCLCLEEEKEFSPMKAFNHFKLRGIELFLALSIGAYDLRNLLKNIINSWARFCFKDKYRKKRHSTLNALITIPIEA